MQPDVRDSSVAARPPRRRLLVCAGLALGVGVVLFLWFARSSNENAPQPGPAESSAEFEGTLPVPHRTTSPFLNSQAGVKYAGTEQCRNCHDEVYESFRETAHQHSASRPAPSEHLGPGVVEHQPSGRTYRTEWKEHELWHHESLTTSDGSVLHMASHPMKWQIGSGHAARSYLMEDEGMLFQSPVTWYSAKQQWGMSPGYDGPDQVSFRRVAKDGCLLCHVGQLTYDADKPFRYRIVEHAIGCERCHGPGDLHVRRHSGSGRGVDEIDRTIVNPAHLSRTLSESVCAQCHLQGDIQVVPRGRRENEFRPGLPLHDYRLEFRKVAAEENLRIAGHVEQLHDSRCYQKSPTLTCTTCHDPHRKLDPVARLGHYRAICSNCHRESACGLPVAQRQAANSNDCTDCHMPHVDTEVKHVALTHHRIGVHAEPKEKPREDNGLLKAIQDLSHLSEPDKLRAHGLASLAMLSQVSPDPQELPQFDEAVRMLEHAYRDGVRDAETITALAEVHLITGDISKAAQLAERSLGFRSLRAETKYNALTVLAESRDRLGDAERATQALRELTVTGRNPIFYFILALNEERLGDRDAAIAAMRAAIEIDPATPEFHHQMSRLLLEQGDEEQSDWHKQRALQLTAE